MKETEKTCVAVCGLHMKGYPLNVQLTSLGAEYIETTKSAPCYKLYALSTTPEKPGMVKVSEGGCSIEVEVWSLTYEALGKFLNMIPSPLGLGQILLINNTSVTGFICEPYAIEGAIDISSFGGYRYYLESKN
ncbi:MAG: hypothetical protein MJ133_02220 [Lachnospiraceae bacterium]|nr:hypothetical protein [Lachnospiraceae bacterium]